MTIPFYSVLLITLLTLSCNRKQEKAVQQKKEVQQGTSQNERRFIYEDASVTQSLTVNELADDKIEFTVSYKRNDGSCVSFLSGIAYSKNPNGDPEIDEDEEGIAYPSREYVYEGNCRLAIRIALNEKDKAKIKSSGCEDPSCLAGSGTLMLSKE